MQTCVARGYAITVTKYALIFIALKYIWTYNIQNME